MERFFDALFAFLNFKFAFKLCSSKFKSFSYLYNEDQFIAALTNDVTIVKSLPPILREARKRKEYQIFKPKSSAALRFYTSEVLPRLKKAKVIGLILTDGGCLEVWLFPSVWFLQVTVTLDVYKVVFSKIFGSFQNYNELYIYRLGDTEILKIKGAQYMWYFVRS